MKYDFSGWATKNDVMCSDGRIIRHDAFKDDDGRRVPLVWNHVHTTPQTLLGYAVLKNKNDGVYAYCSFNDSDDAAKARISLRHGDIDHLSICANNLKQNGADVIHGRIREVSLVLAGANPGAVIDDVMIHGDGDGGEAIIYTDEEIELQHSDDEEPTKRIKPESTETKNEEEADKKNEEEADKNKNKKSSKTVDDVLNELTEEQRKVVYGLVGMALDASNNNDANKETEDSSNDTQSKENNKKMKHNVFESDRDSHTTVLSHSDEQAVMSMAKQPNCGSFQLALKSYCEDSNSLSHGIDDIDTLFPDYKDINPGAPELITDDQAWISVVMNGVSKSPISRVRTRQADIRNIAELRGLGYKKGDKKKNSGNIKLVKRTTDPQMIYVRDALNRDDIIDITDFDVVSYMQSIMRMTLNEELATAILIGDGRDDGDDNKISEEHIRSIWHDDELYTIHAEVDVAAAKKELQGTNTNANFGENYVYAEAIISASLYAREQYKGSGNLTFFCTPHLLNVMLLARDLNGRRIYDSKNDLAAALNVSSIQTVEQFEGKTRTDDNSSTKNLLGIFVNLNDYQIGSAKGGEITKFNQFDIDFNQEKCLIETRLSGALKRVYSAIVLEETASAIGG